MVSPTTLLVLLLSLHLAVRGEHGDHYVNFETEPPRELPCLEELSAPLTHEKRFHNGSLLAEGLLFPLGTYWLENGTYFGCPCNVTRCLRICPADYLSSEEYSEEDEVIKHPDTFNLTVWHEGGPRQVDVRHHFFTLGGSECGSGIAVALEPDREPEDAHHILHNGSLVLNQTGEVHGPEHFCVLHDSDSGGPVTVVCLPEDGLYLDSTKSLLHTMYPVFLLLSVIFLALTLLAFAIAPEMRNLHGRCQASYAATLLFGFLFLAITQIHGDTVEDIGCYVLGLATYFFLLSSFFWLNVLCFDIWCSFSGLQVLSSLLRAPPDRKFLGYSCYAWGAPSVLFLFTLVMQFAESVPEHWSPGIGMVACWFQSDTATFIYFNGPISVLLLANVVFFVWTTVKLVRVRREAAAMMERGASRERSQESQVNEERFFLYIKLFLIMGISWIMEIVSWAVGGPEEWWYVTDIFNTLQGVLIFLLFVVCTRVRHVLLSRLFPCWARQRAAAAAASAAAGDNKSSNTSTESNVPNIPSPAHQQPPMPLTTVPVHK